MFFAEFSLKPFITGCLNTKACPAVTFKLTVVFLWPTKVIVTAFGPSVNDSTKTLSVSDTPLMLVSIIPLLIGHLIM